jgi:predicted GNAT family acetyltransferase
VENEVMPAEPTIAIADNPDEGRYEVRVDDELAGFAQYKAKPGQISFTHTEVDDRFEGQGLAGKLVSFALGDVRERGLAVLPFCTFVRGYIQRHPELVDLVPAERRAEFDL